MKNLLKKNQLMITALAVMIAIAGYLQFSGNNPEEYLNVTEEETASTVGSTGVITENYTAEDIEEEPGVFDLSDEDLLSAGLTEIESLDSDLDVTVEDYLTEGMDFSDYDLNVASVTPEEGEVPGEAVFTAGTGIEILSDAKLLKEQTRAKNKETFMEIINSALLTEEQKQDAVNGMVQMTQMAEKESAAEILLEAKGFSDVVVSLNDTGVDVVVNALELSDAQRAQIEDIVCRKTGVSEEDIIISTVVQ